jgi:hypothetical protein
MSAGLKDEERRFNTPCFLKETSKKTFDEIREGLTRERDRLIGAKRGTDEKILFLLALEKRAEKKPAMANHRPNDWFSLNDTVVCYVGNREGYDASLAFVTAKVVNGYRHGDGSILVNYEVASLWEEDAEGCVLHYDPLRPEVMHSWEFDYLIGHLDFASFWVKKIVRKGLKKFDVERFLAALAREAVRREREDRKPSKQ